MSARSAYGPKSSTAFTPMEAFEADRLMYQGFIEGSRQLLKAIKTGHGPKGFIWGKGDGGANWKRTPAAERFYYRVDAIREAEARADKLRVSRDPCPVCATRMDIGCEHRRVA